MDVSVVDHLAKLLTEINGKKFVVAAEETENSKKECESLPLNFSRSDEFLTQQVFKLTKCETEIMRYVRHLEKKDLGLDCSMIPLGG